MRTDFSIARAEIPDVLLIRPATIEDSRGSFSEVFRASALSAYGVNHNWVQDNIARSTARGTVRGLHFQSPPHAQAKIIRAAKGAIFDVAVDIRRGSPTFGRHVAHELSAGNALQLYVPEGFAHGYCTLTADAEAHYKVSAEYALESESGVLWDDPALSISWPIERGIEVVTARDRHWPNLGELVSPF